MGEKCWKTDQVRGKGLNMTECLPNKNLLNLAFLWSFLHLHWEEGETEEILKER